MNLLNIDYITLATNHITNEAYYRLVRCLTVGASALVTQTRVSVHLPDVLFEEEDSGHKRLTQLLM